MRRLLLAAAGVVPVSLIGASTFGVVGLRALTIVVLLPAVVAAALAMWRRPGLQHEAVRAIGIGMVSTACYDVLRFSFLGFGLMNRDLIPHIGTALGLGPAWLFGYLWRYLGNGGGLAVAFVMLGLRGRRADAIYGTLVCAGLLTVLVVSPLGTQMLFPLNAATVVMAVSGHLVYGIVLGHLASLCTHSDASPE